MIISIALLLVLALAATGVGVYPIKSSIIELLMGEGLANDIYIFRGVRLPRIVMAMLVGSLLAVSGCSLQGIFRNPLATPDLIGVTAGATLMAALTIVLGEWFRLWIPEVIQYSLISVAAFTGALFAIILVYGLAKRGGKVEVVIMLLAGVAVSALGFSLVGLLTYVAKDDQLRDLTFWNLGSLGGATWTKNGILLLVLVGSFLYLLPQGKALNALMLGETDAEHLGIQVETVKRRVIVFSALMVGVSVAFCGSINFIGLVVPYLLRLTLGSNFVYLLPFSAVWGAILLLSADTVSRTIVAPAELPVGILTALLGAPVFVAILKSSMKW